MKKILGLLLIAVALSAVFLFLNRRHTPAIQPAAEPVTITVNYDGSASFQAQSTRIEEGAQVTLNVTSSIADELHFHGYDLHTDLEAGKPGIITFTANQTGRFEFELENHSITLGVVEVYPK